MNEKTIFLIMFLVSSALLFYVENSEDEDDKYEPECKVSNDSSMMSEDCVELLQEGIKLGN